MLNLHRDYQRLQDEMRSLEISNMTLQLWVHFNQLQNDNLQALTHKWIKEHQ